jgi:hypothetical protein
MNKSCFLYHAGFRHPVSNFQSQEQAMKRQAGLIFVVLTFVASNLSYAANDNRVMVELPAPMRAHMLQNMRGHLVVIDQLLKLLSEEKLDQASDLAEFELGMSSLNKHGAGHIAPYYPEAMRQAGTAMHKSASRFSRIAQEGDVLASVKALREITAACTTCHAGYKVH